MDLLCLSVEKAHIYFQDDVNVGDAVIVYVGMTRFDFLEEDIGAHEIFNKYKDDVNHAFRAKKIFLHPKLQTSKVLRKKIRYITTKIVSVLQSHTRHCSCQAGETSEVQLLCETHLFEFQEQ